MLQGLVDFDGYYLESDPCLVCNNPEVPYTVSYWVFSFKNCSRRPLSDVLFQHDCLWTCLFL